MPIIYYTEYEHVMAVQKERTNSMELAQRLCIANGGQCIRGVGGVGNGEGEYCDICPSVKWCPEPFKLYSK